MKKTDSEKKKVNAALLNKIDSSTQEDGAAASFDWTITRRTLMRQMALAGVGLALPWDNISLALQRDPKKIPSELFKISDGGKTVVGPFGQVRVVVGEQEIVPTYIEAAGGLALMDFTGRKGFVRFGNGKEAIKFTTDGVQFGEAPIQKWDKAVVSKMVDAIVKDRRKAGGAMLLRSTLHTSYPVAVKEVKTKQPNKARSARMGKATQNSALSISLWECTKHTVTETVETFVTESIEVIKSAAEQYEECYNREISRDPCKSALFGAGAGPCATALCLAKGFIDLVVGFIDVVTRIVEEVVREVTDCKLKIPLNSWPNPWVDLDDIPLSGIVAQPRAAFSRGDIDEALRLLRELGDFLGPYGCILDGRWSIEQLETPLMFGKDGKKVVLPYGVRVCISEECATQLCDRQAFAEALGAWGIALSLLAALSPEAATVLAPIVTPLAAGIAAIIAAAPPAVVAVAALILAFLLEVLWYATAISGQLAFHRWRLDGFRDHNVCIVHPTFAIALVTLLSMNAIAVSIPPIVVID